MTNFKHYCVVKCAMDCSGTPGGPFTGREHDFLVRNGAIEIQTRWTLNDLVALLARKMGIEIEVSTNRQSNLPKISGSEENVQKVLELLESYEFNIQPKKQ